MKRSPLFIAVFAVFTLLIFLASVQLGWHYAVDGEVSMLTVPFIWWLSGRLLGYSSSR